MLSRPLAEVGAYEAMWAEEKVSVKTLSERFAAHPGYLPSDFVPARPSGRTTRTSPSRTSRTQASWQNTRPSSGTQPIPSSCFYSPISFPERR